MATFNLSSVGDISLVNDWSKLQSYLYQLRKQLQYMFDNLNPEENFSSEAYEKYLKDGEKASKIEQTVDHISLEMLTKDNVVSAINLSEEGVKIQGDKISLEGLVTVNSYFKIGLDGSIEAVNGKFSGDITASSMNSSNVTLGGSGTAGELNVLDANNNNIGSWTKNGVNIRKGTLNVGQFYTDDEYTQIGGFYVTNSEYDRDIFQTEDERCGISADPGFSGGLWYWAGYNDTDDFDFAVNASGLCVARNFQILGGETLSHLIGRVDDLEDAVAQLQ